MCVYTHTLPMRMIFLQWMYWFRLRSSKQWQTQRTALSISVVTGKEGIQATYRHTLVGRYPSLGYVSVFMNPRAVTSGIAPILWSPISYGLA